MHTCVEEQIQFYRLLSVVHVLSLFVQSKEARSLLHGLLRSVPGEKLKGAFLAKENSGERKVGVRMIHLPIHRQPTALPGLQSAGTRYT